MRKDGREECRAPSPLTRPRDAKWSTAVGLGSVSCGRGARYVAAGACSAPGAYNTRMTVGAGATSCV